MKKLYSGGRAGCIHFNAQEDEWWSPKKIKISDKDKDEAEKNEDTGVDDLTMFEKETSSCCIIDFNHLQHALEETAVCKLCSYKQNKNILDNTVDEYLRQIKKSLDISIPWDLCDDFKKRIILRDDIAQKKIFFCLRVIVVQQLPSGWAAKIVMVAPLMQKNQSFARKIKKMMNRVIMHWT